MAECIFCKIGDHSIPAEVLYEDRNTLAFLDINPHSPGHTMIIPKTHASNIIELTENEIPPLFLAVKKMAEVLIKALDAQGLTIGINQGRVSGQTIDHLHIHILPRFTGDGGGSIHSVVYNPPKESLKEIAQKIKNYMKS